MTHLKLNVALGSGRHVEFTPLRVRPVTWAKVRAADDGVIPSCRISWNAAELVIDGGRDLDPSLTIGVSCKAPSLSFADFSVKPPFTSRITMRYLARVAAGREQGEVSMT